MPVRLTIIGAGPGGYVAAIRAAQLGARVTLVEEAEVGGTCLNKGCIPTKTIIASTSMLENFRNAGDFGIEITGKVDFNLGKIRERKNKVVATQIKGIRALLKSRDVELIEGRGSLSGPNRVSVRHRDGSAIDVDSDKIIIATGSRPATIAGFTFDGKSVLSSDDAVQLVTIPKSLLIIGAGVIGSEFAFIYRALGAEVTLVELMDRALSTEDVDISAVIEREMKKAKIKLLTGLKVESVERDPDGMMLTVLSDGSKIKTEQILVSIGRSLNTEGIGLEQAGVKRGLRGEVTVNDRMETNVPGVYAIGDITGKILLAHVASHQGLIAAENAMGGNMLMDYTTVPSGIFTTPEIGSVGVREQVLGQNTKYRTGKFQFRALGKAHAMGEIAGVVKIIADADSDRVIGVHICGAHATDLIHEGVLAMKTGATARNLAGMIHAHPTLSEAIMEAAEDVHGTAIHALKTRNS